MVTLFYVNISTHIVLRIVIYKIRFSFSVVFFSLQAWDRLDENKV